MTLHEVLDRQATETTGEFVTKHHPPFSRVDGASGSIPKKRAFSALDILVW